MSSLFAGFADEQTKSKPTRKPELHEVETIVTGIGLRCKIVNDSLAVIPYGGENIESFRVVIQKMSDLDIIFTNLVGALPGRIGETKYKYLLQLNEHFDGIKIVLNAVENTEDMRADA